MSDEIYGATHEHIQAYLSKVGVSNAAFSEKVCDSLNEVYRLVAFCLKRDRAERGGEKCKNTTRDMVIDIFSRLKGREVDLQELTYQELSIIPIIDMHLIRHQAAPDDLGKMLEEKEAEIE